MRSSPLFRRVFRSSPPSPRPSQVLRPQERQWLIVADADAVLSHSRHGGRRRRWVVDAAGRRGGPMRRGCSGLQQHDVARDEQQRRSEERRCGRWAARRVGARSARPVARHVCASLCILIRAHRVYVLSGLRRKKVFNSNLYLSRGPMRIGYRGRIVSELCYCSVLACLLLVHTPSDTPSACSVRSINLLIRRSPLTPSGTSSALALVSVPEPPQAPPFWRRETRPPFFGEFEARRRTKFLRSGLHKACPTWQLLL